MTPLLEVRGLTVELSTPAGWVQWVNEVPLSIGAGESLGLVGESGSGKTMLSRVTTQKEKASGTSGGFLYSRSLLPRGETTSHQVRT